MEGFAKQENLRFFAEGKKRILGFNIGQVATYFLEANSEVELICFDTGENDYETLQKRFGDRIKLIISESFESSSLGLKSFDGVHIEESHSFIFDTLRSLRLMTADAEISMTNKHSEHIRWANFLKKSSLFTLSKEYQGGIILAFHRPRIAMCTLIAGEEYSQRVAKCSKSLRDHCEKWKIPLYVSNGHLDPSRPIPWSKIILLQNYLSEYDFLFWIDADVMICNDEHSLDERLLLLPKEKDVLISQDHPHCGNMVNSGSFLVRNSEFGHSLLKQIYEKTEFINHQWWEQGSFNHLIETSQEMRSQVVILPGEIGKLVNAYHSWDPIYLDGDWMIHYADIRGQRLQELIERQPIESKPIDLNQLLQAIKLYW